MAFFTQNKNIKSVNFSLDLDTLSKSIEIAKKQQLDQIEATQPKVRSTVFSVGKDPRVLSLDQISTPDLFLVEILHDQLKQLFLRINWKISRFDTDSGQIVGFNVYRKRIRGLSGDRLTISNFEKLSKRVKKVGRFNFDKKGISYYKKDIIPLSVLNAKLSQEQESKSSQATNQLEKSISLSSEIETLIANKFEKIAYVDYTKFIKKEKQKKVFVEDANFINLSFDDRKVGYRETFEYFVTSITKSGEETHQSDIVKVLVFDSKGISPPLVTAKQINENSVLLSVNFSESDQISQISVLRKSEDEIVFKEKVIVEDFSKESVDIVDNDARYSKTYVYRVFLKNIDGIISNPTEITVFSSAQKITEKSRSNNLKIPIVSAVQDQNSDFIKVIIFPNDPKILYYQLERRDLTIGEKKFSVPSAIYTNFGGIGWANNKFFVDKNNLSEIVFIDNLVSTDHIYQYRILGLDIFGNSSSYAFSLVKSEKKKSLRSPIAIQVGVLRQFPIRIKLLWQNDNANVDKAAISYLVQRRKQGEVIYESFPLTKNEFLVDEALSEDIVPFSEEKIEDTFESTENVKTTADNVIVSKETRRSFGMPDFLKESDIYFYRIKAVLPDESESNFTEEIKVSTLSELSDPLGFKVSVENIKVRPLVAKLSWRTNPTRLRPDQWIIERRIDDVNDTFKVIGKAYLKEEFFDRDVEIGNRYVYRIKSVDTLHRESAKFEARLSL